MKIPSLLIVLGILILPQVSMAVWWNPISWFTEKNGSVSNTELNTSIEDPIISTKVTSESPSPNQPTQINTVIRTIEIDNPKLKSQIDSLLKENQALREQIIRLSAVKSQLNSSKDLLVTPISETLQSSSSTVGDSDVIRERKQKVRELSKFFSDAVDSISNSSKSYTHGLADGLPPATINEIPESVLIDTKLSEYSSLDPNFKLPWLVRFTDSKDIKSIMQVFQFDKFVKDYIKTNNY